MTDPPDSSNHSGIPDETGPLEDPLLDAIERSIEDPAGFSDPLIEQSLSPMDELDRDLDRLESAIEEPAGGAPLSDATFGEPEASFDFSPQGPLDPPDEQLAAELEALEQMLDGSGEQSEPVDLSIPEAPASETRSGSVPSDHHTPRGAIPPSGSTEKYYDGRSPSGRLRHRGSSGIRIASGNRVCPDCQEIVNEEYCHVCEKYRHWPEGTDQEPRECWYEWKERESTEHVEEDE